MKQLFVALCLMLASCTGAFHDSTATVEANKYQYCGAHGTSPIAVCGENYGDDHVFPAVN
jgi:hypothetical protein